MILAKNIGNGPNASPSDATWPTCNPGGGNILSHPTLTPSLAHCIVTGVDLDLDGLIAEEIDIRCFV